MSLTSNPQAISQPDDDGALPLHRAAKTADVDTVQFLHSLYPKALSSPDREGLLPLHYASQRQDKANLDVLNYILAANPNGR